MEEHIYIAPSRTANICAAIRAGISTSRIDQYVSHALTDGFACLSTPHLISICEAIADLQYESRLKTYGAVVSAIVCIVDIYSRAFYALNPVANWDAPDILPLSQIATAFLGAFSDIVETSNTEIFESVINDNDNMQSYYTNDEKLFGTLRGDPKGSYAAWEHHSVEYIASMDNFERNAAYQRLVARCTDDWAYSALLRECALRKKALRLCTATLRDFAKLLDARASQPAARPTSMPATTLSRLQFAHMYFPAEGLCKK